MTHPNFATNGASLEDCHTNLFALTDLSGIKWRRLLSADNVFCVDPLDDPVLLSFTKCISSDILCIWRRVHSRNPEHQHRTGDQIIYNKELWIFWYGDEPDLTNILCSELQEMEQGSWENGLSYECRTLLFKALHNLIEKCLLSRNFIRLGKWFVQPYDNAPDKSEKCYLSLAFSFFVHGESTICASIDVRQHPPVRRLTQQHIVAAQGSHSGMQVILCPYGLSAMLTGQTYKETDQAIQKLIDEWKQFYPIDPLSSKDSESGASQLPCAVEVLVGGVRMRYPSCYVLVVDSEEPSPLQANRPSLPVSHISITSHASVCANPKTSSNLQVSLSSSVSLTPPTSPCDPLTVVNENNVRTTPTNLRYRDNNMDVLNTSQSVEEISQKIMDKVWQGSTVNVVNKGNQSSENLLEDSTAIWDFTEPSQKTTCTCSKSKTIKSRPGMNQSKSGVTSGSSNPSGNSKHQQSGKTDKLDKQQQRHTRGMTPFHRRSPVNEDVPMDIDLGNTGLSANVGFGYNRLPGVLPQLQNRNHNLEQMPVGSPASAAPSPLVASHSQPSINQTTDPTMPTLSPHPPASKEQEGVSASGEPSLTFSESQDVTPSSTNNTVSNNSDLLYNKDSNIVVHKPSEQILSPYQSGLDHNKRTEILNWAQNQTHTDMNRLKRPRLPSDTCDDDDEDKSESALYDYSAFNAWLEYPVKKSRLSSSLPSSYNSSRRPSQSDTPSSQQPQPQGINTTSVQKPDPYEFVDDFPPDLNILGKGGLGYLSNSKSEALKEEHTKEGVQQPQTVTENNFNSVEKVDPLGSPPTPKTVPAPSTSLMREKDLIPTYNDLNQLFDTDGESDDDTFQVPTPPNTFKGTGSSSDDANSGKKNGIHSGPTGMIELSQMFPTPPSLDQTSAQSPCGTTTDATSDQTVIGDGVLSNTKSKADIYPNLGSPIEESIKDWSYVFKPPQVQQFVGSSKYAPLANLPSVILPSITLPKNCIYKPSWQYNMPIMDKHPPTSHFNAMPHVEQMERLPGNIGRVEVSPAPLHGSVEPRMPMSYELPSPASNASSYMNKNLNSMDNSGTVSQIPEAHSLLVNLILSDSLLNIFKDHNFDSCTICVCNMNIKGADAGIYVPDSNSDEPQYKCTCGFSAVKNRQYSRHSGLFYEDEVDITGIREDWIDQRKSSLLAIKDCSSSGTSNGKLDDSVVEEMPPVILELIQMQCATPYSSCNIFHKCAKMHSPPSSWTSCSFLLFSDGCEACYAALEHGKQAADNCSSAKLDESIKNTYLHKWPLIPAKIPTNSQDVVRMLKSLQPLLQDAIQKKRTMRLWDATYTVSGPLTWRQFHRLAGRSTEDQCEPQPIPSFLLGYDKDWMSLSPFAVKYWDKLLLEPYSMLRDIAYVVVAPENDFILNNVKNFFKELSGIYEVCKLGRHCPITKVLRDGIMRVGKTAAKKLAEEPVDEWFNRIGVSPIASKLKLYAQVCRHHLAPHLAMQPMDSTLLESPCTKSMVSPMPPPTPETEALPTTVSSTSTTTTITSASTNSTSASNSSEKNSDTSNETIANQTKDVNGNQDNEQDENLQTPALVVYIVDPFSFGNEWEEVHRLTTIGLLRCYSEMVKYLPENIQSNITLQIIPLEVILEQGQGEDHNKHLDRLKALAISVFSQCRRSLAHMVTAKSLTGLGPAASQEAFLKSKDEKNAGPLKLYSPTYTLAPMKDKNTELGESFGERKEKCTVLFCNYCLSDDQRWLLASCTDDRGELLETCIFNIEIPNRNRRKKASARKVGLQKLWEFLLGIVSLTTIPCRVVIGRLGRLGHGELKGWSSILSRKSMLRASKHLKDICKQCSYMGVQDTPCILSACLVSLEPDPSLQVMPDSFTQDDRFGSSSSLCTLSTPHDASCTHILVFPTSATTQANPSTFPAENIDLGGNLADEDFLMSALNEDLQDDQDLNLNAIFNLAESPVQSPVGSPRLESRSQPGSPIMTTCGRHSPFQTNGPNKSCGGPSLLTPDQPEEAPMLLQQPLALGYYVSTAKTGALPSWFWSSCPHAQNACPAFLKSALHIHCPSVQQSNDDPLHSTHTKNSHPLDSNLTTDVLRYVLECYNSLSWLSIDPSTHDRRSCLPIHLQVLMQIYHAVASLV